MPIDKQIGSVLEFSNCDIDTFGQPLLMLSIIWSKMLRKRCNECSFFLLKTIF